MLTGRESKWGTSLPPVSISCQVCSLDIDYVQGSTLRKIEYHRVNITVEMCKLIFLMMSDNLV